MTITPTVLTLLIFMAGLAGVTGVYVFQESVKAAMVRVRARRG